MPLDDFRPYLLRAFYTYLVDKGLTPYIHVFVNEITEVPVQFVVDQHITLNIGPSAISPLHIDKDEVSFQARFAGELQSIRIPLQHVLAIYAKENTELLLTFALEEQSLDQSERHSSPAAASSQEKTPLRHLKVIKKKS